jgi:hypothetical protein
MWISLLSIRTLHADKILIVVRDGVDASRPQCALAPFCHQPRKQVRRKPGADDVIRKAEMATDHYRISLAGALSGRKVEDDATDSTGGLLIEGGLSDLKVVDLSP